MVRYPPVNSRRPWGSRVVPELQAACRAWGEPSPRHVRRPCSHRIVLPVAPQDGGHLPRGQAIASQWDRQWHTRAGVDMVAGCQPCGTDPLACPCGRRWRRGGCAWTRRCASCCGTSWSAGTTGCAANATRPPRLHQPAGGLVRASQAPSPPDAGAEDRGRSPPLRRSDGQRQGLNRPREPACTEDTHDRPEPISTSINEIETVPRETDPSHGIGGFGYLVARVAAMHKLPPLLNAMMRDQTAWQPPLSPDPTDSLICRSHTTYKLLSDSTAGANRSRQHRLEG